MERKAGLEAMEARREDCAEGGGLVVGLEGSSLARRLCEENARVEDAARVREVFCGWRR